MAFFFCSPERTKTYYIHLGCRCRVKLIHSYQIVNKRKLKTKHVRISDNTSVFARCTHAAKRATPISSLLRRMHAKIASKIGEKKASETESIDLRPEATAINCVREKFIFSINYYYYCGNLECNWFFFLVVDVAVDQTRRYKVF